MRVHGAGHRLNIYRVYEAAKDNQGIRSKSTGAPNFLAVNCKQVRRHTTPHIIFVVFEFPKFAPQYK